MPILSDDIQLIAPAPGPVTGVSAMITGTPGNATYYYWWVASYPIGIIVVSAPLMVRNAPSPLTVANHVTITGRAALGATGYDLLRTNSPQLPSTAPSNIAIAGGLPSPTFQDVGNAPLPYDIIGLAAGAPVSEFITLNNRDFATPTLVVSPFGLAVPSVRVTAAGGVTFPDGSTQTTAGQTPLAVPAWRFYSVTLVGANWQITASDGTVTTVPRAAALSQNIPLGNVPANAFFTFSRCYITAGPAGGTTTAHVDSLGTATNPGVVAFYNLDLHNPPLSFIDLATTPGNVAVNTPETLELTVVTTGGNINQITAPCTFVVAVLWGVTS